MYFFAVVLIGLLFPFLFYKTNANWAKWIPALVFLAGTLGMGIKARFFPGPEMQVLGEFVYFMILGCATIGAILGGIIVGMLKSKNE